MILSPLKPIFHCLALSQPGPTKKRNEDALLLEGKVHQGSFRLEHKVRMIDGEPLVFAVADGVAGSPYAHIGSSLLLQLLDESFRKSPTAPANLRNRLLELQETYVERGRKMKCRGTAATLAGIVISGEQVQIFNVGDSRVYGIANGTMRQLSRDHTELADMIESGAIESIAAKDAPSSYLQPSSFFMADGMHSLGRVYTHTMTIDRTGAILICSDGLIDVLDDDEIAGVGVGKMASWLSLIGQARKRKGNDDITMMSVVRR